MSVKSQNTTTRGIKSDGATQSKKRKKNELYLVKILEESGLIVKTSPDKSIADKEIFAVVRNFRQKLKIHFDYPQNIQNIIKDLQVLCKDLTNFKHFLLPNIIIIDAEDETERQVFDGFLRMLVSIPELQEKVAEYIFERAIDLAVECECSPVIKDILKCFTYLETMVCTEKIAYNLINLLDVTSEKFVTLEIITAIPDILGDQEHENISKEMGRLLTQGDDTLIPFVLDCLANITLSNQQYQELQKKTLNILRSSTQFTYFPNFAKFLLMPGPGKMDDNHYFETVSGIRNALDWTVTNPNTKQIESSQLQTATAIRTSIVSSKILAQAWMKTISACKTEQDHKPFDLIILLIFYSTTEEQKKQVENIMKKHLKLGILAKELINEAFKKFKPILEGNVHDMIELINILLRHRTEEVLEQFAVHWYIVAISEMNDKRNLIAELLQFGRFHKKCLMSLIHVLSDVASKDITLLKPQSLQILSLLDDMDDMNITEIREIMKIISNLAYSFENSGLRDELNMIIRKQLSSCKPVIKVRGIISAVQGVKYLTLKQQESDGNVPDETSYNDLPDGPAKEAAELIELISRSTERFPDLITFYYDKLTEVISTTEQINNYFLSWITSAVTNDLQDNFIVDRIAEDSLAGLKLTIQYGLNEDDELDEFIAVNIAGLALQAKAFDMADIVILPSLLQLVQTLHAKSNNNDLTSIDALLGCPVILPEFDIELVEDINVKEKFGILDCLIHTANWFRELVNGFASQKDVSLKKKMMKRLEHIEEIENIVAQLLTNCQESYKPPACVFNSSEYINRGPKKPFTLGVKGKTQKKNINNSTLIPCTSKSQPVTQTTSNILKSKVDILKKIPQRTLNLNILHLMNEKLDEDNDIGLNINIFKYMVKAVNQNLSETLICKIKKVTFLTKETSFYDAKKAEKYAKIISNILPDLMMNLEFITAYLHSQNFLERDDTEPIGTVVLDHINALECVYETLAIYFKWIGFKNNKNGALLKSSLRTIATNSKGISNSTNLTSFMDLLLENAKFFQKHEEFCVQISTAIALIDLIRSFQEITDNETIAKLMINMSYNFLTKTWLCFDGSKDKGQYFNLSIGKIVTAYLIKPEIRNLKTVTLQIRDEIEHLHNKNDTLVTFKSINKTNFPLLYRELLQALFEATKTQVNKRITNNEHLDIWKDSCLILKTLSEIAKNLEHRNYLSGFLKKSQPIIKLFLSNAMPIIEITLKTNTETVTTVLELLQKSTRFLQSLCCQVRLNKDTALMSKIPQLKFLLETLIYKVKAALVANNCSQAFWMGNLKNKNLQGQIIESQDIESNDEVDDCDEQLPDDSDNDDELPNPDSKSISDIV